MVVVSSWLVASWLVTMAGNRGRGHKKLLWLVLVLEDEMLRKLARMPLKWKALLGAQAVATAALAAKRADPAVFDSLFEKRVLIVTKKQQQQQGPGNDRDDGDSGPGFQISGYSMQVKKPDGP